MRKKLFVILMSIAMIMTFLPTFAFADESAGLPETVEVKLDSVDLNQKISFDEEELFSGRGMPDFNYLLGIYNGREQTLDFLTEGVTAEYSWDEGKTWTTDKPTFKRPTYNLSYLSTQYGCNESEINKNAKIATELFEENAFQMRIVSGDASSEAVWVLPFIMPQEWLTIEFKATQLNYAPGKIIKPSDVLELKTIKLPDRLYEDFPKIFLGGGTDTGDVVEQISTFVKFLGNIKGNVGSKYQKVAKDFLDKYFQIYDFPKKGTENQVKLMSIANLNLDKLEKDLQSDNKLVDFICNYDISPIIFQTWDINKEINDWVQIGYGGNDRMVYQWRNETTKEDVDISINFNKNRIGILGNLGLNLNIKSLKNTEDLFLNVKAVVNYSTEYNKISASNVTKTYHVKNAKTLSKSKSFTYKAKAEYGKVTFKKVDGSSKLTINKKTGKVTVKKGLKRGKTYSIKVLMRAPGKQLIKTIKVKIAK